MNKVFTSVFATAFAAAFATVFTLCASAAFAYDANSTLEGQSQMTELTDATSVEGNVIMRVAILLPDGSTTQKKGKYSSMAQALVAYHQFADTLPRGSKVSFVEFTDNNGNIIFSYQG